MKKLSLICDICGVVIREAPPAYFLSGTTDMIYPPSATATLVWDGDLCDVCKSTVKKEAAALVVKLKERCQKETP